MNDKEKYTNSININKDTPFPYMMIKESNLSSFPLTKAFRVMHWHEDLQFIYVTKRELCVKTLGKKKMFLPEMAYS